MLMSQNGYKSMKRPIFHRYFDLTYRDHVQKNRKLVVRKLSWRSSIELVEGQVPLRFLSHRNHRNNKDINVMNMRCIRSGKAEKPQQTEGESRIPN
ncbi:hypothetical protein HanXRQr2_Chr07g0283311 [Helianthus annuus]|uniref:Uncharacterized protein n=1 Tax=Helianthus annuus TaxID=4232 RepID=A0A251UB36_HELAN|nr:hypothetical protein HanXRQr2_Chr07g0283311 [Helianthus annuus]KAJ0555706.1 hypothetical protein HanIR_Chr07g0305171 [Helianthus annuus]KAJ0903800.1 hypothetical protein HanPSC8_Chr07g0274161 [Helianthus annuus]